MIPYYFAHRSCGFGSPGDAALIFCFVLHQGKMNWSEVELKIGVSQIGGAKYKPAGALEKNPTILYDNNNFSYRSKLLLIIKKKLSPRDSFLLLFRLIYIKLFLHCQAQLQFCACTVSSCYRELVQDIYEGQTQQV